MCSATSARCKSVSGCNSKTVSKSVSQSAIHLRKLEHKQLSGALCHYTAIATFCHNVIADNSSGVQFASSLSILCLSVKSFITFILFCILTSAFLSAFDHLILFMSLLLRALLPFPLSVNCADFHFVALTLVNLSSVAIWVCRPLSVGNRRQPPHSCLFVDLGISSKKKTAVSFFVFVN